MTFLKYRLETVHAHCFRLSKEDDLWSEYYPTVEAAVHYLHGLPEALSGRVDVVTEEGRVYFVIFPG
jgi:hypothetical protein